MKRLKDMRIAGKLITSFVLIAVVAAVVGAVGVYFIQKINQADTNLYEANTMGISYMSDAEVTFQRIRFTMVRTLLDTSLAPENMETVNDYIKSAEESFENYQKKVTTEDNQKLFDDLTDKWNAYVEQLQLLMDKFESGDDAGARELVFGSAADAGNELQDAVDTIAQYNIEAAHQKSKMNDQLAMRALYAMLAIIGAGVIVAIVLGLLISRLVSVPVNKMVNVAKKLSLGDVEVEVDVSTKDEIGILAKALKEMIEDIRNQAYLVERIADGDMTVSIHVRSEKDILAIKLAQLVEKNNEVLGNIAIASEQVAAGSRQVSDSSMALSQGATEQASAIEELTASLEEISSQTKLNARNAGEANELAEVAKNNAVEGNSQMKEMQHAMAEINVSSNNISKIIKVIDEIAFQTNILALNAAVEAARAGAHGKGFAVVAEEVRNLAARSANAAKETTDMIESSILKVEAGTKIANDTANALNKIVEDVAKAADLVAQISVASNEQATGIAQINQGIMQVSEVVQNNSATAEESAAASEELSSQADLLKEAVERFQLKESSHRRYTPVDATPLKASTAPVRMERRIVLNDEEFGKY
ncbi:MAG: methyl-accepting chemotaxis protein [Clostridiales bacterium]|nr:methyl-accepting chemotaxis protein [Clostridiales bacterium]